MKLAWHWTPGAGGLLALVPDSVVSATLGRGLVLPAGAAPVRPLHLTCLASRSMQPLVGVVGPEVLSTLPGLELPPLVPRVEVAERGPHPLKDPPGTDTPRRTGFLAVSPEGQLRCRAVLRRVVDQLDRASRAAGGPAFPHPEPDRFFHLSVWNNRGGRAMRSIGDIGPPDVRG